MSLPQPALPTCFSMFVGRPFDSTRKFLYLRGGHATNEEYARFGEIGPREALTSSMHTRFYLVPSKKHGDEQLMHIKSSYNNKYLVAVKVVEHRVSPALGEWDVELPPRVATADEPDEELSKPSCTLFKVLADTDGAFCSLIHPWSKKLCYVVSCYVDHKTGKEMENIHGGFSLVDVTEQIILPPYVTFKGDKGLYLRVVDLEGHPYLEFASVDKADTSATFTTLNYPDGTVCLKSELNSKFLGLSKEWIWSDSTETTSANLFRVLKYGDFFALQNMSNKQFCITTKKDNRDCLNAGTKNITDNAKLWLEEPVLTREIYNIEYHRSDHCRIYDTTDMNMVTASAFNRTSEKNTVKSSLSITTTESSKYESTTIHKGNVSVSLSGGFSLLKIIQADVEVQGGYEGSKARTWGNASETEKKQQIEYEISVPPNKKVTLTVTSKQAKYDVPFSYTQRDKLPNGEIRIYNYDDGLYSGMNCFDLRYETKEEEIETKEEELESSKKRKGMAN